MPLVQCFVKATVFRKCLRFLSSCYWRENTILNQSWDQLDQMAKTGRGLSHRSAKDEIISNFLNVEVLNENTFTQCRMVIHIAYFISYVLNISVSLFHSHTWIYWIIVSERLNIRNVHDIKYKSETQNLISKKIVDMVKSFNRTQESKHFITLVVRLPLDLLYCW